MSLFEVKGWNLNEKSIAVSDSNNKKSSKKNKKRSKSKKQEQTEGDMISGPVKPQMKDKSLKVDGEKPKDRFKKKRRLSENSESADIVNHVSERATISSKLTPLQQKMMSKLSGSRFRWINEKLYTVASEEAVDLMKKNPTMFEEYHQGFRSQVQSWPENPVDVFVEQIKSRGSSKPVNAPGGLPGSSEKKVIIADMGCGEAQLAKDVEDFANEYNLKSNKKAKKNRNRGPRNLDIVVHSFDLTKANDRITVADIRNVPLDDQSCSIVIFCLALMGTNFLDFIEEAHRILAPNGELWIAEIKSRFKESSDSKGSETKEIGTEFVDALKTFGFFHKKTDNSNKMFTRFEFFKPPMNIVNERKERLQKRKKFVEEETKAENIMSKRKINPEGNWLLKPCIYKRR